MFGDKSSGKPVGRHLNDEVLSAYIDGILSPTDVKRVEKHLATCAECTRDLRALRHTVLLLNRLPPAPLPRAFTLREADVAQIRARQRVYTFLRSATAAVAVMLAVVIAGEIWLQGSTFGMRDVSRGLSRPEPVIERPAPVMEMISRPTPIAQLMAEPTQPAQSLSSTTADGVTAPSAIALTPTDDMPAAPQTLAFPESKAATEKATASPQTVVAEAETETAKEKPESLASAPTPVPAEQDSKSEVPMTSTPAIALAGALRTAPTASSETPTEPPPMAPGQMAIEAPVPPSPPSGEAGGIGGEGGGERGEEKGVELAVAPASSMKPDAAATEQALQAQEAEETPPPAVLRPTETPVPAPTITPTPIVTPTSLPTTIATLPPTAPTILAQAPSLSVIGTPSTSPAPVQHPDSQTARRQLFGEVDQMLIVRVAEIALLFILLALLSATIASRQRSR